MVWIILVVLLIILVWLYFKFFKIPKIKNLVFIDGGLGAGKSFYSVYLAVRLYKRNLRRYRIARFLFRPFGSMPKGVNKVCDKLHDLWHCLEEPILYSNIPLRNVKHAKLTLDILYRYKRVARKSVVLIDDVSLLVDQMNFRDKVLNKQLSLFFKLWRHESHGGYIIANSQSLSDVHYAFRYALSDYLYIHHSFHLPFFSVLRCQEMQYSADENSKSIVQGSGRDVEETLKMVLVRNRYKRYYDSYCYSVLTDSLVIYDKQVFIKLIESAKCSDVLTLDILTKELLYPKKEEHENEDDEN